MPIDLKTLTIAEATHALRNGEYTAVQLTDAYLTAAKIGNQTLNAYAEIFDDAREDAKRADEMFKNGTATALTGIPVAVKDNMLIAGKISASGSKMLMNHRGVYDATVITQLKKSGAVILGRTNMDEFAMGSSTETCAYGIVKNPHDLTRVPGGSSGGAAAAVAGGLALVSLGSDTGGSIRQPAALCGIVGLKPTYGAVSRYGLMAMASSFDQIGPFGRTVKDTETLFNIISGFDRHDSTSVADEHPLRTKVTPKEKLVIGVPQSFVDIDGIDPDVRENFKHTITKLKDAGHMIREIELPLLPKALAVYYVLMPAEVSANLARYDGIRYGFSKEAEKLIDVYTQSRGEGFGKEVRRRILLGTYVLSTGYYDAYYNKAVAVRRLITEELQRAFKDVDVIATPTTPSPAFKIGEKTADPLKMYLEDIYTVSANVAGVPGISVPSGKLVRDGVSLPVGIQFIAAPFQEDVLFVAGKAVEQI